MTICNSLGELMRAHEMSCHVTLSCHVISCHFGPTTLYGCTLLLGLQSFVVHLYILGIIAHLLPSVFCTRLLITFIRYYISCAYQGGKNFFVPTPPTTKPISTHNQDFDLIIIHFDICWRFHVWSMFPIICATQALQGVSRRRLGSPRTMLAVLYR